MPNTSGLNQKGRRGTRPTRTRKTDKTETSSGALSAATKWSEILAIARDQSRWSEVQDMVVSDRLVAIRSNLHDIDYNPKRRYMHLWYDYLPYGYADLQKKRNYIYTRQLMRTLLQLPITTRPEDIERAYVAAKSFVNSLPPVCKGEFKAIVDFVTAARLIGSNTLVKFDNGIHEIIDLSSHNTERCLKLRGPFLVRNPDRDELRKLTTRVRLEPLVFPWLSYINRPGVDNEQGRALHEKERKRCAADHLAWLRSANSVVRRPSKFTRNYAPSNVNPPNKAEPSRSQASRANTRDPRPSQ